VSHPELETEQRYVDRAYEHLERMRQVVAGAGDKVDGEVAQAAMDAWAAKRLRTYEDAERGLCFGRLDVETMRRPLYIGRRWVHDEEQQQLVVNWQAPAARAFYTATPQDPHGVTLRRRFRTDGRRLLDIADEALDGHDEVAGIEHCQRCLADPRDHLVGQFQQDLTNPQGHFLFETEGLDHVDERVSGFVHLMHAVSEICVRQRDVRSLYEWMSGNH